MKMINVSSLTKLYEKLKEVQKLLCNENGSCWVIPRKDEWGVEGGEGRGSFGNFI